MDLNTWNSLREHSGAWTLKALGHSEGTWTLKALEHCGLSYSGTWALEKLG